MVSSTPSSQTSGGPPPTATSPASARTGKTLPARASASPAVARPPGRSYPTPKLLRGLVVLTVLAVIAFTVLSVMQLAAARTTLSEAAIHVGQLNRVEDIRTELMRADASAAHGLLAADQAAERPEYRDALDRARVLLIEAASAQSGDREGLVAVNRDLDEYAALLEQARTAQGTPESQTALTEAGIHLRQVVIPALATLLQASDSRVQQSQGGFPVLVTVAGALALGLLILTSIVTMVRFRRVLNLGLAAALILVGVAISIGVGTLVLAYEQTRSTAQFDITTLRATAAARGHGYDARAHEARGLLTRSPESLNDAWNTAAQANHDVIDTIPDRGLHESLSRTWEDYTEAHEAVRSAAADGQWDRAAELATSADPASAGGRFAVFDTSVTTAMNRSAQQSGDRLLAPGSDISVASILTLLCGVAAAGCTIAGVRPRLREFA